jgi:hypothetical protein
MRAYAPTIAQGEGISLGEWRIGVFSLSPLTIHQERQKTILQYKVIVNKIHSSNLLKAHTLSYTSQTPQHHNQQH